MALLLPESENKPYWIEIPIGEVHFNKYLGNNTPGGTCMNENQMKSNRQLENTLASSLETTSEVDSFQQMHSQSTRRLFQMFYQWAGPVIVVKYEKLVIGTLRDDYLTFYFQRL